MSDSNRFITINSFLLMKEEPTTELKAALHAFNSPYPSIKEGSVNLFIDAFHAKRLTEAEFTFITNLYLSRKQTCQNP